MKAELTAALAAEEAAIYAYGLIGVRLPAPADRAEARAAEQAHRIRRDVLIDLMSRLRIALTAAPAAYLTPFPVTDRRSALELAVHVENGVARAWHTVLPVTADADRMAALAALTDSAVRATRWRRLAGVAPTTLAFPGDPGSSEKTG